MVAPNAAAQAASPASAQLHNADPTVPNRGNVPEMAFWSAAQLAQAIREKKIGCVELLDAYLARVDRHNPRLNAIVDIDAAGARKRAKAADDALMRGDILGPLHGIPVTIKDSIDVAGLASTWGIQYFKDNRPAKSAPVVDALTSAGAIVFGKTNVPLGLLSWETFNDLYGTTNNPWDLSRSPGGSSGGSAAALAAGLTALEIGSDSGGSMRNPAHYCGVYAHRPTFGITSGEGQSLPGLGPLPEHPGAGTDGTQRRGFGDRAGYHSRAGAGGCGRLAAGAPTAPAHQVMRFQSRIHAGARWLRSRPRGAGTSRSSRRVSGPPGRQSQHAGPSRY